LHINFPDPLETKAQKIQRDKQKKEVLKKRMKYKSFGFDFEFDLWPAGGRRNGRVC